MRLHIIGPFKLGVNGSISTERRCEDQLGSRAPGSKFADPKKPGKYVTKNLASQLTFNLDFDCDSSRVHGGL